MMATAIQFTQFGNFPMAVVFSMHNRVKWVASSEDFPESENQLCWIPRNSIVPLGTVAHDVYATGEAPNEPQQVRASEWFWDDKNLHHFNTWKFKEQCIYYRAFNGVLSFIYTY
jgi:hypothetical protein